MAIFHLSVKTISRSAGRSATAAAAYRSGKIVHDERTGLIHDYSRRHGVSHSEIVLPKSAPSWAVERERLWNAAEQSETRKNSTVAREFEVALPAELSPGERLELARGFARALSERHRIAVDVAIHAPGKDGDTRNHHAHLLCSTRRLLPEGFKDKARELDDQKSGEIIRWRKNWAELANQHLEKAGHKERIDCRTLEEQRYWALEQGDTEQAAKLERLPGMHMGPDVAQMEKRGIETERGDQVRAIAEENAEIVGFAQEGARAVIERESRKLQEREAARQKWAEEQEAQRRREKEVMGEIMRAKAKAFLERLSERHKEPEAAQPEAVKLFGGESAETVKQQWQAEKEKQFILIAKRARTLCIRTEEQAERQKEKIRAHDKEMPQKPTGLLAGFKQTAYNQAYGVWNNVRIALEARWQQLARRFDVIVEYMRKSSEVWHQPSRGEVLAEKKAGAANPELAERVREVAEREKAEQNARMRAERQERERGRDDNGISAGRDDDDAKESKKQKIRESFQQKVDRDRSHDDDDNSRGRGGGRGRGRSR